MKNLLINLLLRLYPRNWRNRYKEEFVALLEDYPFSLKLFADVIGGAVDAHLNYKAGVVWHLRADIFKRLLLLALVGFATTFTAWIFKTAILQALLDLAANPANTQVANSRFINTDITQAFMMYFWLSLYGGILVASPVAVYLLLGFLRNVHHRDSEKKAELAGVKIEVKQEKRGLFYSIPLLTVCWLVGAAFAYTVLVPSTVKFMFSWTSFVIVKDYIDNLSKLIFWTGLIFEIPALVYLLAVSGVVRRQSLRQWWPGVLVLSVIIAFLMTPSLDVVSVATCSLPVFGMYWLGLLAARLRVRQAEIVA